MLDLISRRLSTFVDNYLYLSLIFFDLLDLISRRLSTFVYNNLYLQTFVYFFSTFFCFFRLLSTFVDICCISTDKFRLLSTFLDVCCRFLSTFFVIYLYLSTFISRLLSTFVDVNLFLLRLLSTFLDNCLHFSTFSDDVKMLFLTANNNFSIITVKFFNFYFNMRTIYKSIHLLRPFDKHHTIEGIQVKILIESQLLRLLF